MTPQNEDDFQVLGLPLSPKAEALSHHLTPILGKCAEALDRLFEIKSLHLQYVMLRMGFNITKISHLMRTLSPEMLADFLAQWDHMMQGAVERLLGWGTTSPTVRQQIGLPVQLGGMGLPAASAIAPIAFVAGYAGAARLARSLFSSTTGYSAWDSAASKHAETLNSFRPPKARAITAQDFLEIDGLMTRGSQHEWTSWWHAHTHSQISAVPSDLPAEEQRQRACLLAATTRYSGSFLSIGPATQVISNTTFHLGVRRRLGLSLIPQHRQATCLGCIRRKPLSTGPMDSFGDHIWSCSSTKQVRSRVHNNVRDLLLHYFQEAGFEVEKEVSLPMLGDRGNRGADIYVKNWFEDRHLAIDLTVRNPTTPGYLAESSRRRLAAAYKGERDKTTYYGRTLDPSHFRVFKFQA
ncbi:MAG: hypothetical protein AAF329_28640, partial [Cyanobacteria bacterium P01_A01_bin.17]